MNSKKDEGRHIAKNEIVIRKYGLLDPDEWGDDCESEIRLMDDFWNKLIDIHENYVSRYLVKIAEDQDFKTAKIEYDRLVSSQASLSALAVSKKQLGIAQKVASRRMKVELGSLELSRREEVKAARQNSGLWWGNYNAIVRSFERARNAAIRGGNTMRRRAGGDSGRITNTLQGGADLDSLYDGTLSQLMVRPPSGRAWSAESRGERRRLQRTTLSATVFVRDGERRIVTWPMIMHRPIPADCSVKEVTITRRRVGGRQRWSAIFLCTRPVEDKSISVSPCIKRIGIDIGWRRLPEGLRVATVLASGEQPQFVILPEDLIKSFSLVDELRQRLRASTRQGQDLLQIADAQSYTQPFQRLLFDYQSLPGKTAKHLAKFCLSTFFLDQQKHLIDADLLSWRKDYMRLSKWLSNQQRKVVERRNHFYQNIVIKLFDNVSEVVLNNQRFGAISLKVPQMSDEKFFPKRIDYYRNIAAPSALTAALKLQAAKRGIEFVKREVESPVRCPECGSTSRKTRADALPQVCSNCNTSFDQDVATCAYLLKAF